VTDPRKGPTGSMTPETFYNPNHPRKSCTVQETTREKRGFDREGGRIVATVIKENSPQPPELASIMFTSSIDKASLESYCLLTGKFYRGRTEFTVYGEREHIAMAAALRWVADLLDPEHLPVREKEITE